MPTLTLKTVIKAPIHRVFDLSRSIDLHKITNSKSAEKAIAGRTTGLINKHEAVTWRAMHLGITQKLTSIISEMEEPFFFEDTMIKGVFKTIKHKHYFWTHNDETIMQDVFYYKSPMGFLGILADRLFLKKYLLKLLKNRNAQIKEYAENQNKWMQVLNIY